MSANQVCKSFTAVMVLLVGVLGSTGWGAGTSTKSTKAQQTAECRKSCVLGTDSLACQESKNPKSCEVGLQNQCVKECIASLKDDVKTCAAAFKEYSTSQTKSNSACKAFDKSLTGTCGDKVAACGQKINGTFAPTGDGDDKSGADMLQSILMQQITSSINPNPNAGGGNGACVKQFDAKAVRDAEKELKREKKDLEKEIKKEADEQLKLTAEQRTKTNEISKKIAEIEKDLKKEGLKKDADMRKQISDAAKVTLESAKKLRTINLSIAATNNQLAQDRLTQQTAMLGLTDEKTTFLCKNQLLAAKNGILKSGTVDLKSTNDNKNSNAELYKNVADQVKNLGAKGTGNLKSILAMLQKQCFEDENNKKNQMNLTFNQKVTDNNNRIKEFQSQIDDEKKQLALSQDNIKKIQEETDKEKSEEEKAALKEIANLNKELADNETSINEKINLSRVQTAKLNQDIQNLVLKTNTETEMAFVEAQEAIGSASDARISASAACECDDTSSGNKAFCSKLRTDDAAVGKLPSGSDSGSGKSEQ